MDDKKSRIGPQLPEGAHITCKSGSYLPVSGGQLALVMAEVTTTNHCGKNTDYYTEYVYTIIKEGGKGC